MPTLLPQSPVVVPTPDANIRDDQAFAAELPKLLDVVERDRARRDARIWP
jgi:hypothetical protein